MFKGRFILPVLATIALICAPQAQADEILKLDDAYSQVIDHNPQIRGYTAMIKAAEGNRIQQALSPNPEAVFEAENFAGDSPREGFDAAEYTLGIEQQIEIAGKRSKREELATHAAAQTTYQALAGIQSILARTKAAYINAVIAQERMALARKRVILADKTHETVKGRITAAKSAEIQHTKADIEVTAAKMQLRRAEKDLHIARTTLANLMGRANLDATLSTNLPPLPDIPEQDAILQALNKTPMATLSRIAVIKQQAALDLAEAGAMPDPTIGLGVRRFAEDDGSAFLASLSIPIPVSNRNQGNIAKARADLLEAQSGKHAQELELQCEAMELWHILAGAKEEALSYRNSLLPSAEKAYRQAETGFDRGAFTFLELLDAQRTLFNVQEGHLDAMAEFYETKSQIDMLTGEFSALAAQSIHSNKGQ